MKLYLVAGETSGDSRGAELMRALRERIPDAQILGAGGREMRQFGGDAIFDWADEAVVGLWDVLKKYGYFRKQFHRMLAEIAAAKPAALITIDYPGFNMRLAKAAKKRFPNLRTIHYVSPQVWAWHRGRIPKMAKFLDLMLCLFPFELPLYANAGLRAVCTGHPLLDSLAEKRRDQPRDPSLVALLPGSRGKEVRRIFPVMVDAAMRLRELNPSLRFEAAAVNDALAGEMRDILRARGQDESLCPVTVRTAHDLMQRAGAGMVCSGTATLESAFFGLPMVILYKIGWLTHAVARQMVKIPCIGLPNVLAGREIAREFIQSAAQPGPIASAIRELLENAAAREAQQHALAAVIASLGDPGAARRAAGAIANTLALEA